jgi:hypothetical protein
MKNQKYYRLDTKNNFLRFESKIKVTLIKNFQELIVEQRFEKFEQRLSYQFFKHSFELCHYLIQPSHLDWLRNQFRLY